MDFYLSLVSSLMVNVMTRLEGYGRLPIRCYIRLDYFKLPILNLFLFLQLSVKVIWKCIMQVHKYRTTANNRSLHAQTLSELWKWRRYDPNDGTRYSRTSDRLKESGKTASRSLLRHTRSPEWKWYSACVFHATGIMSRGLFRRFSSATNEAATFF